MLFSEDDIKYMRQAIALAEKGLGMVSPNPPVGCVIVNSGKIVGRGWHKVYGGPHAEPNALLDAGDAARGATAYVTLMPCNHHGKTPPCTQALIKAGVSRVVVAVDDPNPESGDGLEVLRGAGLSVQAGLLSEEAAYVMRGFLKCVATSLPFVTFKYAMTLDGRIAAHTGDSKWISGESSREMVQSMRARSDAVMVGIGTAIADDPRLNVRDPDSPQPRRVIVDSSCRLSPEARIFEEPGGEIYVVCSQAAESAKVAALENRGARIIRAGDGQRVDLELALKELSALGVRMVFCEGGGTLAGSLVEAGLVDEVAVFIAPKIIGGASSPGPVGGGGFDLMKDAARVMHTELQKSGEDILLTGCIGKWDWFPILPK